MGENVYLNGDIISKNEASIPITDRGFLYGDALIETLRTYKRAPFMLQSHLNRLTDSADELGIKIGRSQKELKEAVYDVVKANNIEEAIIRITLTRGNSVKRSLFENLEQSNLLITIAPIDLEAVNETCEGASAITGLDKRGMLSSHKSTSMLPSIIAFKQAQENGAFDMIQISKRGFVSEASRANVFVVLDGILLTPMTGDQVLSGITRKVVIEVAQRNGIKAEEDAIVAQDLSSTEEIFLTNSLYEIVPITSLDNKPIASGEVGPITKRLQNGYRMLVENWLETIGITVGS